jgi:hypothetical protein
VQTELKVPPDLLVLPAHKALLVLPAHKALLVLLVQTDLKVPLAPLVQLVPLAHKVLPVPLVQLDPLALREQRMQQISLVFWPSPTAEPDQPHRILWT